MEVAMGRENMNVILSQVPRVSYLQATIENSKINADLVEKKALKKENDSKVKKVKDVLRVEKEYVDTRENHDEEVKRKIDIYT